MQLSINKFKVRFHATRHKNVVFMSERKSSNIVSMDGWIDEVIATTLLSTAFRVMMKLRLLLYRIFSSQYA
jgi:hypothetical protein